MRGTTYLGAFFMQAVYTAITLVIGMQIHRIVRGKDNIPLWKHLLVLLLTSVSVFVTLLVMHVLFGYGAALVDDSTHTSRRRMQSLW